MKSSASHTRPLLLVATFVATAGAVASPSALCGTVRTPAFQPGFSAIPGTAPKMSMCASRPSMLTMSSSGGLLGRARTRIGNMASYLSGSRITSRRTVAEAGERRKKAVGPKAMFTGIVEEVGEVSEMFMDIKVPGVTLTLKGDTVLEGAYEGCSISVNGVCLTVTKFTDKEFTVGVAPETLRVTNLGELIPGSKVNLERAAAMDGRNSGHMVQGHVDDTGDVIETWPDKESLFFKVKVPKRLMPYIVPKGFVAIDGTSLTVCETNVSESWFTFMLIDYTQKHVIIPSKKDGGKVNVEVDVMSKYVERAISSITERLDALEAKLANK